MNPHRASLCRHPLAQLAVAFASGICAANYFPIQDVVLWIAGGVCTLAALVAVVQRRLQVASIALLLAVAWSGALLAIQERKNEKRGEFEQFVGRPLLVTGVLLGPPEKGRDRLYLTLGVERIDVNGSSRIGPGVVSLLAPFRSETSELEYRRLGLRYGSRIRVATKLRPTDGYLNPGVSPLAEFLDRKGYDATGVIESAGAITLLNDAPNEPPILAPILAPLGLLYSWRAKLQDEIHAKFAPETAGVLDAALLGNRYNLSRETSERFRDGGTFHVLVISGLHISFIGAVVFMVTKRLTKRRILQFVVPALIVWAYSLAVGAESSVVRAALMFTLAALAPVLWRESSSLNALGGAALALLVHSPKELFDPSFQLTFLSVLAIVAIAWPLLHTLAAIGAWYPSRETTRPPSCTRGLRWFCELLFWRERKWKKEIARSPYRYRLFKAKPAVWLERYGLQACLRYTFAAVIVSAAVQLVLLPLMIVYFHRLSLASLILNIVVGLLLAMLTAVALLALVISQLSVTLAAPLFTLANAINDIMVHSVDPFAHFNLASIRLPEYSGWGALVYVLYYIPLLVLAFAKRKRALALVGAQLVLVVIVVAHPFSAGLGDGKLRIDFLDVGQGDAALITFPGGRTLLVDGGGATDFRGSKSDKGGSDRGGSDRRSVGEAVVSEYLWWRGLDTIDYVLPTHADADHIDGLNDVLRNFTVHAALVARAPANDAEYDKFSRTVKSVGTPVVRIQAGDVIRFGDVGIEVLWPPLVNDPAAPARNNDSTVLRVGFGKHSMLLTGDIEKGGERALLAARRDLQADVVKVPHHGSRSSSTLLFVSATKARVAVISVGKNSMFGHPHREVVERWQASGAQVLTTGECGTITIATDGHELTVTGMQTQVTGMQTRTSRESPCHVRP